MENASNKPSSPLQHCTPTKRCALGSPPGRPLESWTASQAVVEVTAAMGVPPRPPQKKNGKAATANSQGSSIAPASQSSPCHSGWGTSHHHKSHKKDASKRCKKVGDASPAQKSAGHKVCKDGGHH